MIILNNLAEKPSLISHLEKALRLEGLALTGGGGSTRRPRNFSKVIVLKPRGLMDDYGEAIGGVLEKDPNHIVIYDMGYLSVITKMVQQFELISEGIEVTVEIRAQLKEDFSRDPI